MKTIVALMLLITPFVAQAQKTKKIIPPKIVTKLKVGDSYTSQNRAIKFIEVLNDSRCPVDVSCVWAGQAKVRIGVYEKDKLIEEFQIIVGAKGITPDTPKELVQLEDKKIMGYNLTPLPISSSPTNPEDYFLELLVK